MKNDITLILDDMLIFDLSVKDIASRVNFGLNDPTSVFVLVAPHCPTTVMRFAENILNTSFYIFPKRALVDPRFWVVNWGRRGDYPSEIIHMPKRKRFP